MWRSYRAGVGASLFRRFSNSKLARHIKRRTRPAEHSRKPDAGRAKADIKAAVIVFSLLGTPCLKAQVIDLGAAQDVTILGASTVTNTGATTIVGNLALSPGSSVTGFPPGTVQDGTIHINDALANQAHADAFTAYTTLAGEVSPPANNLTGQNLGGLTLTPGVYHFNSSAQLTGILDLNTLGNPDAVFHFQIGSTLTTASNSSVVLLGTAASDPNIFWQVGSSATIGTGTLFQGNILALASITVTTGASITGRALAINAAVTLDTNSINGIFPTSAFWNGGSSNLWSDTNWSPDATGATTGALAPNSDVVFSVTGVLPQKQNTLLDFNTAISSLTINDPAAVTISGPFVLSISGTGAQTGITVNPGAGLVTINSALDLSGPSQTVTVNNSAGLVINGPVGGTIGLTKLGAGLLTLTAAETYTGPTLIAAGTLQLGDGMAAGTSIASSSSVTIDPAAILALNLRSTETFGNDVTNNGLFAAIAAGINTIAGVISGTGVFLQNGTGTSIMTGINTYNGGTFFNAGVLAAASDANLGTGPLTFNGGTLEALTSGGGIVANKPVTLNAGGGTFSADPGTTSALSATITGPGSLTVVGQGSLESSGANNYSGGTNLNGGVVAVSSDANLGTGPLTFSSGTLEALAGGSGITSSKAITINGSGGTFLADLATVSVLSGLITGPGALKVAGQGSLVLTGLNDYSGGTDLAGGVLAVSNDNNLGTGPLTFDGGTLEAQGGGILSAKAITINVAGGTFLADLGSNSTLSGEITGAGGLTKDGLGALTLSGTSNYLGPTSIIAGTLRAGSSSALSLNSAFTVNGILDLNANSSLIGSLAGSGTVTNNGLASAVLSAGGDGTSTLFSGTLEDGSNPLGLTKIGAGTLTLTGTSTYSGATTVSVGTLQAGSGTALSPNSAFIVNSGLDLNGNPSVIGSLAGGGTVTNSGVMAASLTAGSDGTSTLFTGTLTNGVGGLGLVKTGGGTLILSGANTYSRGTTISAGVLQIGNGNVGASIIGNVTDNATLSFDGAGPVSFSGAISGTGGLMQVGTGTLQLSGLNLYTGPTLVSTGTLSAGSLTAFSAGSAFTVNAILDLNGFANAVGSLAGSGTVINNGAGPASLTEGADGTSTVFSGTIADGLGLVALIKAGAGTLALTGVNTYSGGTTILAGTLQIGNGPAAGSIAGDVTDNAILAFDQGGLITFGGVISGPGEFVQTGTGTVILAGNNLYTGSTTVSEGRLAAGSPGGFSPASAFIVNSILDLNGFSEAIGSLAGTGAVTNNGAGPGVLTTGGDGTSTIFSGTLVDGASSLGAVKIGLGTLTLSGSNTYSGATAVNAGTLQAGSATAFSPNSSFTVTSVLDLNGFSNAIGSLAGAGTVTNNGPIPAALSAGADNSSTTFAGVLHDGVSTLGLSKNGTGTLILSGVSSYSGLTDVQGGVLSVQGTVSNSPFQLENGAALSGSGTIHGPVTILTGGTLSPGTSTPGTLSVDSLVLNAGSVSRFGLGPSGVVGGGINNLVEVAGNLTLGGSLNVTNLGGFGAGVYRLFDYGGVLTNNVMTIGTVPVGISAASLSIQIAASGQVNLLVGGPALFEFWDGATVVGDGTIHGGNGTWNTTATNWTNAGGTANSTWPGQFTIFEGAAGTVTLAENVGFAGLQFVSDGYVITSGNGSTLTAAPGTILRVGLGVTGTIDVPIVGAGNVTKTDQGTVILTEANTYSGGTTISGGTLQIGNGSLTGSIVGDVVDNGLLVFDHSDSLNFAGALSGSGALTQAGAATLTLSGINVYSGATLVSSGVLQAGSASALSPNSAFTVNALLDLNGYSSVIGSLAGTGTVTNNGLAPATLTAGGDGTSTLFSGNLVNGALALALVKNGAGTLTLSGINTYTGTTTLNGGTLQAGSNTGFNPNSGFIVNTAGVLDVDGMNPIIGSLSGTGNVTNNGPLPGVLIIGADGTSTTFGGTLTDGINSLGIEKLGPGMLILTGTNSYSRSTIIDGGALQIGNGGTTGSIAGNVSTFGLLAFDRSDAVTFPGNIDGFGNVGQRGIGALTFSGVNSYAGSTLVSVGPLVAGSTTAFSANSAFTISSALDLNGFSNSVGSLTGLGAVTNNGATAATLAVGGSGASTLFAGTLTDGLNGLGLTKDGPGTLTLTGANTYSGPTLVTGGTLQAGSLNTFSPNSFFTVNSILDLNGNSNAIGSLAGSGTVTNNAGAAVILTAGGDGTSTVFTGTLADGIGTLGVTKTGAGTLTLSGLNTYGGPTTVSAGTLAAGSGTAFSPNSAFTVNSILDLNSNSNVIGSLAGSGIVTNSGVTPATLSAGGNNSSTVFSGSLQGALGLNKTGSGTLNLTGVSSYGGLTDVLAGTLSVQGSTYNSAVQVESGATLSGNGTIHGSVTVLTGGILSPGTVVPGTLTITPDSLVLSAGSVSSFGLGPAGVIGGGINSLVEVGGNLTLGGTLNVIDVGGFGTGVYRLFDYGGVLVNNGMSTGTVPAGIPAADLSIQTATLGQVNLLVSNGSNPLEFWDGATLVGDGVIHGGSGTWNSTNTNWTNAAGTSNSNWNSGFAVFQGVAGTVTLAESLTFSGLQFDTSGYVITSGNGPTLTALPGTILRAGSGISGVIDVPIVGAGDVTKTDAGTIILTGANTYTGGTTISGGTLQIGNGGSTGSIVGDVVNNGILAFDRSDLVAFGGAISGTGSIVSLGRGIFTLSGVNIYSGPTLVSAGTLQAGTGRAFSPNSAFTVNGNVDLNGNSNTVGSLAGAGTVINNGATPASLTAGGSGTSTLYSGLLVDGTSTLGLVKAGSGTLVLSGANTYSRGTVITSGVLQIGNGGMTGSITGDVTDNATLAFNRSDALTFGGVVSGPGGLSQLGLGTLILTGNNLYTGATTIWAGILQVGNGGTTGALGGVSIINNAILDFDRSNSITYGGVISGSGLTLKDGTGTLILTGSNTYLGGTTINSGTLQLGNGGESGSIVGPVLNNGILAFNRSDVVSFAGPISGTGSVEQDGLGTTILSGINTYAGGTVINAGTLTINGPQALGVGNLGLNGGVLNADPQPINVRGGYTQGAGGTLQLQLAGENPGQYASLIVGGNAALNGTLQVLSLGFSPKAGNQLTLVSTGGVVSGRFARFVEPFTLGAGFDTVDLVYGRQSVTLEFLQLHPPPVPPAVPPIVPTVVPSAPLVATTVNFDSFAFTANQRAAAGLLDAMQLNPSMANLFAFLYKEPFAHLPGDLEKILPDGLTSFYEISFSDSNIQRLNLEGRLDDLRNGANGFNSNMKINGATLNLEDRVAADGKSSPVEPVLQHTPTNRWGVWVTGFGDFVNVNGDGNANGYNFTTGGVTLGVDYRLTDSLAFGIMADYSHTWTSLRPRGHIGVDSGRVGVYATWFNRGFYLNGAIFGGYNTYESGRAGLKGMANGSTEGTEWSTFISGGYDFHFGHLTVGPIASLQYTYANIDGFNEKGSLAPLDIHSGSAESLRSDVGFRAFYQWQIGEILVEPSLKVAWEHEYKYSALPIAAGFAGIPGPSARFFGPNEGHDSAVVNAGISVRFTPAISAYISYDGELGRSNYSSNAVTGGVSVSF